MAVLKNIDFTTDILIDRLIKETTYDKDFLWRREDFNDHTCYYYRSKIDKTKSLNFRVYHYKTHDFHIISIIMSEKNDSRFIPIKKITDSRVYNLIRVIRDLSKYYYKE